MLPTAPHDPRKQVVYNPHDHDWTALFDCQPIGNFARPTDARAALDAHAHTLLTHPTGLPPAHAAQLPPSLLEHHQPADLPGDPTALYTPGGPMPGLPLTAAALDAALAHFCTVADQPKVQERAHRARALLTLPDRWTIQSNGDVQITGKGDTYIVTDACCRTRAGRECPDQKFRTGVTGSQCYHTIARELLRLAQIIASQDATPAFVTLNGRLLGLAMSIAVLAAQPIIAQIAATQLTFIAGDTPVHRVCLTCADGAGEHAIQIAPDTFAALWGSFRPVATSLELVQLFLDRADPQLVLSGGSFSARAPGSPVPSIGGVQ